MVKRQVNTFPTQQKKLLVERSSGFGQAHEIYYFVSRLEARFVSGVRYLWRASLTG